jgi:hypothetical protein
VLGYPLFAGNLKVDAGSAQIVFCWPMYQMKMKLGYWNKAE